MKVRELLEKLEELPPNLDVLLMSEDEDIQREGHLFRLFEVIHADVSNATFSRTADQVATLELGKHPGSKKLAIIGITSDI